MTEELRLAMRSLHRLMEFKEMKAPEILISAEQDIFLKRFKILNNQEIAYFNSNFESYRKGEIIRDAIGVENTMRDVNAYMLNLN